MRRLAAALAGLAAVVVGRPALAQQVTFYLDRVQLSGAPDDGFTVWRPHMYDETRFYGMVALGYSQRPLRADTVAGSSTVASSIGDPVVGQFQAYLLAGTQVASRVSFNIALPLTLYKIVNDPTAYDIGTGGVSSSPAAHDMRFDLRLKLLETNKLGLGAGMAVFAPTGNAIQLAGDDAASTMIYGAAEYNIGKLLIAGMIGPHFRPDRGIGGARGALFTGSELRWSFGAYYPLKQGRIRPGVELFGSTGIQGVGPTSESSFFTTRNTDLEWLAQVRFVLDKRERFYAMGGAGTRLAAGYGAPDFRLLASIGTFLTMKDFRVKSRVSGFSSGIEVSDYDPDTDGDGIPDSIDKCPTLKEDHKPPDPNDGCPAGSDRDGDGIPDADDMCPDEPEDKDGIQDADGCPETDADHDGVPDTEDKCPLDVGLPENHGCPKATHVDEETGEVRPLEPIQFEFGKATIKPVSYPIVNEVVAYLKAKPKTRMGVYGHTDNVGSDATNLTLSKQRAAAVMQYIVDHGIKASRLESEGYGKSKPITTNNTAEGRAKNRRVEFKILSE